MTHERIFRDIRHQVAKDLRPVRPLAAPWKRSALFLLISMSMVAIVLAVFGLRMDFPTLGVFGTWGFSGIQLSLTYILVLLCLRTVIPGLGVARSFLVTILLASIAANLYFSWMTFRLSPSVVAPGVAWQAGIACFLAILTLSGPPIAVGWFLASRGLPSNPWMVAAVIGLAAGLAAEATWRLHCTVSSPGHVFPFHKGAVAIALGIGTLLAGWWMRRASRSTKQGRGDEGDFGDREIRGLRDKGAGTGPL